MVRLPRWGREVAGWLAGSPGAKALPRRASCVGAGSLIGACVKSRSLFLTLFLDLLSTYPPPLPFIAGASLTPCVHGFFLRRGA